MADNMRSKLENSAIVGSCVSLQMEYVNDTKDVTPVQPPIKKLKMHNGVFYPCYVYMYSPS